MRYFVPNKSKIERLIELVNDLLLPEEYESATHEFKTGLNNDKLANCYLVIVAICHQTSPIGENVLIGTINESEKKGWDYLKEKYLVFAKNHKNLHSFRSLQYLTPAELSGIFNDVKFGRRLNRINERTYFINDIGRIMVNHNFEYLYEAFIKCGKKIEGDNGFKIFLRNFTAYQDPIMKKTNFLLSILKKECRWEISEPNSVKSPVDYHELRGHLRIGTVKIVDKQLLKMLKMNLPISEVIDTELRNCVQSINDEIASRCNISSSKLHYFLWNIFRNICIRKSNIQCNNVDFSSLPINYHGFIKDNKCPFFDICSSVLKTNKIIEPPYIGNYY